MSDGGFHGDDAAFFGNDALTSELTQVEGRCFFRRQQDDNLAAANDGARAHGDVDSVHRRQMTVGIFEFEAPVGFRNQLRRQFDWFTEC